MMSEGLSLRPLTSPTVTDKSSVVTKSSGESANIANASIIYPI